MKAWNPPVGEDDDGPQGLPGQVVLVAAAVDFSFVRDLVRDTYGHTGAPSVDPVVIFKMALLGYLYRVPSERCSHRL